MAVLGEAQRSGRRRHVLTEIARRAARRGVYAGSVEELLPLHRDWRTIAPTLGAIVLTLVKPDLSAFFTNGAVSRYALATEGWRQLRRQPPLGRLSPSSV